MDDAQLLRSFVEDHSHDAFHRLVARHLDLVYSAALRRAGGDPHRAEEVTQMVFTDLARKAASLIRHPLLPAWLHQATRWSAASLRRTEQRRARHESLAASDPALGFPSGNTHDTASSADWTALQPLLDEALDSLNATDRAAVLQRFFQQQPFPAIARQLGVSENTARMRVDRALEKLRKQLVRRGLTSTSAALSLALAQHSVTAAPAHLAAALASASTLGTTSALSLLLMTKLHLGLATTVTLALALGLVWQTRTNATLRDQFTPSIAPTFSPTLTLERDLATLDDTLRLIDSTLAASAATPALTPAQQERQQLDTFIRKGELDSEYAPLFRKLRLPTSQLDALKTLLVERDQTRYNAIDLAVREGLSDIEPVEESKVADAANADLDARIDDLIGKQNGQIVRDYIALRPYRIRATGFISGDELFLTDFEKRLTPEYDAQLEKVARTLREKAPTYFDRYKNGWPQLLPEEALSAIEPLLPESSRAYFSDTNRDILARLRMA